MQGDTVGSHDYETTEPTLSFIEDNTTDDQGRKKYIAEYNTDVFKDNQEVNQLVGKHTKEIKEGKIDYKTTLYIPHEETLEDEKFEHKTIMFDERGTPQMIMIGKGTDELGKVAQQQRELEEKVEIDALTGLKNRRGWDNALKRISGEISRNECKGCKLIITTGDLNNLKLVNDGEGHDLGDNYIKAMASVLKGTFQRGETNARIGGDEFASLAIVKPDAIGYQEIESILAGKMSQLSISENVKFSAGIVSIDIDQIAEEASNEVLEGTEDRERKIREKIRQKISEVVKEADALMYSAKGTAAQAKDGSGYKPTRILYKNLSSKDTSQ